jgi:hypothetical protein
MSPDDDARYGLGGKYMAVLQLPRQRELPKHPRETTAQIFARRGTLICLRACDYPEGGIRALGVMPYMADL